MNSAIQAFSEVNFNYVRSLDSVWKESPFEVGDLNRKIVDQTIRELFRQTRNEGDRAIGEVILGPGGTGKTHLVGRLRRKLWDQGGWFVVLDVIGLKDFWRTTALCFAHALAQAMTPGRTQGQSVLLSLARTLGIEAALDSALKRPELSLEIISLINSRLMKLHGGMAQKHAEVFRALYLFCSQDFEASNLAYAWLQGMEAEPEKARALGFATFQKDPVRLVEGLSWIMSLTGPTLVAIDNFDFLMSPQPNMVSDFENVEEQPLGKVLGAGLIDLHDVRVRGMTVLTCVGPTWSALEEQLTLPQRERFGIPRQLEPVLSNELIRNLIVSRIKPVYDAVGFEAPFESYPFSDQAIDSARGLSPRRILFRCEEHRNRCVDADKVVICDSLDEPKVATRSSSTTAEGGNFDQELRRVEASADIDGLLDANREDLIGQLICDVLDLFIAQTDLDPHFHIALDSDVGQKRPRLHGRLVITYLDHDDDQRIICFRAIEHTQWNAFQSRIGAAVTASGMDTKRSLFVVRRAAMPTTPKMAQLVSSFRKAGGQVIDPSDDDLRTFVALRLLQDKAIADLMESSFGAWLRDRKPLCKTAFFKQAGLCPFPRHWLEQVEEAEKSNVTKVAEARRVSQPSDKSPRDELPQHTVTTGFPDATESEQAPTESSLHSGNTADLIDPDRPDGLHQHECVEEPAKGSSAQPTSIPVGHRVSADAEPVLLPTSILPRHTAIIAGAGSGKTVLLRRIVEEAALAGIPAIVIDPNNDLSRLGDMWPTPPAPFTAEDQAKAERYATRVEVVIWTPGIHAGNPLFLSVLPDFSAIGDDPDEQGQAVTMAADTLGPLAGAKANLAKGVLSDALRHFAQTGGGTLKDMIALMADLPEGVSDIDDAGKLAGKMANELKAAVATNPLLKASGVVLDPALLFRSGQADRTRVSVINLSGLASDEAKQDFVNRLQMTLFGWIKKHPSPKGMLYVIDEAQNFLPSGAGALSKTSGVQLVAQARKYGLGMIVVTQAPKGIDNKVVSNCTTQFLGKQNSPTDQATVKEMVAATGGGRADDIGRLKMGEFYFKTEASGKPAKIATPICLTYHPSNPPTPEEVVAKARASVR